MLNPDFDNGKKVNLNTAMGLFTLCMGVVFFLDRGEAHHSGLALLLIVAGIVWMSAHRLHEAWCHYQEHQHSHRGHRLGH